jgi:hypothetical protein
MRVSYVTDVEGDIDFFHRFVALSCVLSFEPDPVVQTAAVRASAAGGRGLCSTGQRLTLADDTHFVFGGDAFDRGPGDLRIAAYLVGLKRRYPDRVHLLIGNRDANKLRFSAELSDMDMARPAEEVPKPPGCRTSLAQVQHHVVPALS